jgi:bacterioferritin
VRIGERVREQFEADMAIELFAIETLRRGTAICREVDDTVTRLLLEGILSSEEEHIDYLETQLSLMKGLGEQEYLSLQVEPPH